KRTWRSASSTQLVHSATPSVSKKILAAPPPAPANTGWISSSIATPAERRAQPPSGHSSSAYPSCETSFMPKTVLVTGSSGLIGAEAVERFDRQGHTVAGIDNNMRREFF